MWKKEDGRPQESTQTPNPQVKPVALGPAPSHHPAPAAQQAQYTQQHVPVSPNAAACISQGIRIKGDVTGSEDLFVDGLVEGKLSLTNGCLTIGPNGNVKADVTAREVIVRGRIDGKVTGRDKVHLWGSSQVTGEVQTDRLAIEEGALLRGRVEAGKLAAKTPESKAAAAAATAGIDRSSSSESRPATPETRSTGSGSAD
jgi:cytoskeletal protein CcmA (bactofilin family)